MLDPYEMKYIRVGKSQVDYDQISEASKVETQRIIETFYNLVECKESEE